MPEKQQGSVIMALILIHSAPLYATVICSVTASLAVIWGEGRHKTNKTSRAMVSCVNVSTTELQHCDPGCSGAPLVCDISLGGLATFAAPM